MSRGLSAIVATVLLIAISFAAIALVWVVVNNLVKGNIDESEACFGIFDKVTLNSQYTCYNNTGEEVWFSIEVRDITDIEDILVIIKGESDSIEFKMQDNPAGLAYLNRTQPVSIPGPDSGMTYIYNISQVSFQPNGVQIAPIIGGYNCGVSDDISNLDLCSSLA